MLYRVQPFMYKKSHSHPDSQPLSVNSGPSEVCLPDWYYIVHAIVIAETELFHFIWKVIIYLLSIRGNYRLLMLHSQLAGCSLCELQ